MAAKYCNYAEREMACKITIGEIFSGKWKEYAACGGKGCEDSGCKYSNCPNHEFTRVALLAKQKKGT